MKLGFITSILDGWNYEEVIDIAHGMGFQCLEVACWPQGKAERRYAGVSHIDCERVLEDDAYARHILDYAAEKDIVINSLAYYPNPLDPDPEKSAAVLAHLKAVILASEKLGVGMVTTFVGRDQTKNVEENLELVKAYWPPVLAFAAEHGVKVGIENCPMLFGPDQWPGGQNIMTTPVIWRKIYEMIPDANFGLNYDPSHFVWQMMDYMKPLTEFKDKLFQVHFKDIKLYPEKLAEAGVMAYPLDYMAPKIPGRGDIDWGRFIAGLKAIGYEGNVCIEVEDRDYEESRERILASLTDSKKYVEQFL
ncbi:MAG: sugar phosphate isomerase/epimerase [Firmicutes bacterium]|nr:sugar phosphate isomerase/epimerase [Bacillota bacterium]